MRKRKLLYGIAAVATCLFPITVIATPNEMQAEMTEYRMSIDGKEINLTKPLITVEDSMYVNVRELAEQMNMNVVWDARQGKVRLFNKIDDEKREELLDYFPNFFQKETYESITMLDYQMEDATGDSANAVEYTYIALFFQIPQEKFRNFLGTNQNEQLEGWCNIVFNDEVKRMMPDCILSENCQTAWAPTGYFGCNYNKVDGWYTVGRQQDNFIFFEVSDDDPNIYNVVLFSYYPEQIFRPEDIPPNDKLDEYNKIMEELNEDMKKEEAEKALEKAKKDEEEAKKREEFLKQWAEVREKSEWFKPIDSSDE